MDTPLNKALTRIITAAKNAQQGWNGCDWKTTNGAFALDLNGVNSEQAWEVTPLLFATANIEDQSQAHDALQVICSIHAFLRGTIPAVLHRGAFYYLPKSDEKVSPSKFAGRLADNCFAAAEWLEGIEGWSMVCHDWADAIIECVQEGEMREAEEMAESAWSIEDEEHQNNNSLYRLLYEAVNEAASLGRRLSM